LNRSVIGFVIVTGAAVLYSKEYKAAYNQIHHKVSTVGDHSFYVACASLAMCNILDKFGIYTHKKEMVLAALCHDLGIIGRYEKYSSPMQTLNEHPIDSVEVSRELLGNDANELTDDIIAHHMWPAKSGMPRSLEGFIITVADKYCAIMETVFMKRMPRVEEYFARV
jgi:uncharacterized protein